MVNVANNKGEIAHDVNQDVYKLTNCFFITCGGGKRMNKRQKKKYRRRHYCWTYEEYKKGNVYSFIQWEEGKSGKSKVLLHTLSIGESYVTRNHRIYSPEVLTYAIEQFNENIASGRYSNKISCGELDHTPTQSFEIQPVGRLTI